MEEEDDTEQVSNDMNNNAGLMIEEMKVGDYDCPKIVLSEIE